MIALFMLVRIWEHGDYEEGDNMKKLILIVLCMFLVLGGCAKKEENGKVTLHVLGRGDQTGYKALTKIIEQFKVIHPEINVKVIQVTDWHKYTEKLLAMFVGDSPLDIVLLCADYYTLVEKDILLNLDDIIKNDKDSKKLLPEIFPALLDSSKYNDSYYGMPAWHNPIVLFYNKKIFDEAGMKYPDSTWDWNKFVEASRKLTVDKNNDGRIDQYGTLAYNGYTWINLAMMQNNIPFINENRTKTNLDSSEAIDAIKWYYGISKEHHASPSIAEVNELGDAQMFCTGRVATMYGHTNTATEFRKIKTFDWDIAPLPKGKRRFTLNFVAYWSISKKSKHPKESWELIKFFTSKEGQKARNEVTEEMPVLKDLAKEICFNPKARPYNSKYFVEALDYCMHLPKVGINDDIKELIKNEVDPILFNVKGYTYDESCKTVAKKINKLLEENKKQK